MLIRLYFFILLIIFLEPAGNCTLVLSKTLNEQQAKLMDSFRPCVIRMVFLEHSYLASLQVHSFLNYYENKATFILKSIPVDIRRYNTHSKLALTRVKDLKFRGCYAIFYFKDQIIEATNVNVHLSPTSVICEFFEKFTINLRNENPTFINFITFRNFSTFSWYRCLMNIDTTSVFYSISYNSADQISNKFGNPIFVASNYHGWDGRKINVLDACAIHSKLRFQNMPLFPIYCLFQEAQHRLNFTEYRNYIHATNRPYDIVDFQSIDEKTFENTLAKNTKLRYELVPYGMVVKSIMFGTVARPINYNIHSLIKSFDISTWTLLFASFLSLCIYFRELLGKQSFLGTHVLSVLLEQSQNIVTNQKKLDRKASCLIILCLLLTFLIANAYKGVLFTILTTPSFHLIPKTTQAVLQSNYTVRTTNVGIHMERIVTTIKGERKYQKPSKRIEQIGYEILNLFVALETGNELVGWFSNYTIPEKLMILELEEDIRKLNELHSLFSGNNFVLGKTLNVLSKRNQWIIRRNGFLLSFLPIISSLMESGIYSRWEHYERIIDMRWEIYKSRNMLSQSLKGLAISKFRIEDNILAYLLFKPHTAKPSAEPEKPIDMKFFAIFLLLYGYCNAFRGIEFLSEKFCMKRKVAFCCIRINSENCSTRMPGN